MEDRGSSRRQFIRTGAAAAAVAATQGLAGCTDALPEGVQNAVGGGGGLQSDWLHEPGALREVDHYRFEYMAPTTVEENEDAFDEAVFDRLEAVEDRFEVTGVDFDDLQAYLRYGGIQVLTGDYDRQDVVEELEDEEFDDEDEHQGYTLYVHDSGRRGVAVGDGTLVVAGRGSAAGGATPARRETPTPEAGAPDAEEVLTLALDTKNGEEDRYVDERDAFSTLLSELGSGTLVYGGTREPPGSGGAGATPIAFGQTVTGELTESDETDYEARYRDYYGPYDLYEFDGQPGTAVTIEMEADDPYIVLQGPSGEVIADGGSPLEARLRERGTHRIAAMSGSGSATFEYSLTLSGEGSSIRAASLGAVEETVAGGSAVTVNGDTTERRWVVVYESESDVDTGAVEDRYEEVAAFDDYDDLSVSASGTAAVLTGTIDTDDLGT